MPEYRKHAFEHQKLKVKRCYKLPLTRRLERSWKQAKGTRRADNAAWVMNTGTRPRASQLFETSSNLNIVRIERSPNPKNLVKT